MANEINIIDNMGTEVFLSSVSSARNADKIFRDFIVEATRKEHNISFLYKETLRAIIHQFSNLSYINTENEIISIKCMHANPERTIAKLTQETNIILPVISVSQATSEEDATRNRYNPMIIYEKVWDSNSQRAYRVASLAPKPVNITYTINVWSKYKSILDQLVEQVRLMFNPSIAVRTPFSSKTKAYLTNEADNSAYEVGDREERIIRKSFDIQVQTYIPNPRFLVTATGEIRQLKYEVETGK